MSNIVPKDALAPLWEQYSAHNIPHESLRISCRLRSGVVEHGEDINIDGILAYSVVQEALQGEHWGSNEACDIPLPIMQFMGEDGEWCYVASTLLPVGGYVHQNAHLHRRAHTGEFTASKRASGLVINTVIGRYKERRTPVESIQTDELEAFALGNAEEIRRLLDHITHIGKRRAAGYGEVAEWTVEKVALEPYEILIKDNRLRRAIPQSITKGLAIDIEEPPQYIGVKPPYYTGLSKTFGYPTWTNCIARP